MKRQLLNCAITILMAFSATIAAKAEEPRTWWVNAKNYVEGLTTPEEYAAQGFDGTTPEKGFGTIQIGVDNASCSDGDTIWVTPGVYDKGGYSASSTQGWVTRVRVAKAITVRATNSDPAQTVIAGQWDPDAADGVGDKAVRCVAASGGAIVWGFTLRNGAVHTASAVNSYAGGFRGAASDSNSDDNAYLVDCVVTNCTAPRGPGMFGGTAIRCRFVNNVGGGLRQARLINSLVTGTVGGNVTFDCRIYNSTLVNNDNYAMRGSARACNCAIQFNASGTGAASDSPVVAHSLVIPWNSTKTTATDSVTTSSDRVFFSPATGDFHPMSATAVVGLGDAALLNELDLPEGLDAFVDLEGVAIPKTGAIYPGAFQTPVDPTTTSGAIVFDKPVVADGVRGQANNLYCRTAKGPGEVHLSVPTADGREFVCFACPQMVGSAVYPQMDDTVWTMTPTNSATGDFAITYAVKIAAAANVYYVNPDSTVGDDDNNDGRSAESPFRTLAKAVATVGEVGVIHAAAGTYDDGEDSTGTGRFRIYNNSKDYLRIKGAGADKSFVYGRKATGTEGQEDGRGADAVRCAYLLKSTCIQGFTLGNSYSLAGDTNANGYRGGIVYAGSDVGQVSDCVLTNGWAYRAGVAMNAVLKRCLITGAAMSTGSGQSQLRGCDVLSCLVVNNTGTDSLLNNDNDVRGCTIVTEPDCTAILKSDVPRNCVIYVPTGTDVPTTTEGCVVSRTLNDFYFVDEESGDWRVAACSPAVGAGEAPLFSLYCSDFKGRPLAWTDGRPTAGAFQESPEYSPDRYVDPVNGDDSRSGRAADKAVKTLKAILSKSALRTGSVVHLAPGTYDGTYGGTTDEEFDLSGVAYRLVVPSGITIVGDKGARSTVLDARGTDDHPVRGVYVNANATLKGVTVCGGYSKVSNAEAAGFRANGATACLVNCIISNNCNAVSSGTSAGNGGSLYGCVVDHNRGNYTGYSINRIENCTFGSDNRQLNGTSSADLTRGTTSAIINSIMIGGTVTTKDTTSVINSVFTKASLSPVKEEVGSRHVTEAEIALNADYTLGANSVARDLCRDASVDARLETDVLGGQRVYNGYADAGAVEYDCRGEFASCLRKGEVVYASAAVTTNAVGHIVMGDAQTLELDLAPVADGTLNVPASVTGTGVLTILVDDAVVATYAATSGESVFKFKKTPDMQTLSFAFDGEGKAELGALFDKAGFLVVFR